MAARARVTFDLAETLRTAGADLDALGARWAIVGGLAVSFRALLRDATARDLSEVAHLLDLIRTRGFHRNKNLQATLARYQRQARANPSQH